MQADETKQEGSQNFYWIPKEELGLIQKLIENILAAPYTKRKRAAEFRSLTKVLKGLKLIPAALSVCRIAYGCSPSGEIGLLVICFPPARVITEAKPGNYAEERKIS